jgi:hypothetical protein
MASYNINPFGAADAAVGYLYQIRIALLLSLTRLRQAAAADFLISLEVIDDVAFEAVGHPAEILQTKHHRNRKASVTNSSPDIWKSLRIWIEGLRNGSIAPGSTLDLLTTSIAEPNSAASLLRRKDRDIRKATKALEETARTSQNKQNQTAYKLFLELSSQERLSFVNNIYVIDSAPNIENLDSDIEEQLFWAVERKHQDTFRQYLEGWWFGRAITHFNSTDRIVAGEIEAQIADLREQFKQDALPIADDLINISPDENLFAEKAQALFVRQIELANAGERRIWVPSVIIIGRSNSDHDGYVMTFLS